MRTGKHLALNSQLCCLMLKHHSEGCQGNTNKYKRFRNLNELQPRYGNRNTHEQVIKQFSYRNTQMLKFGK